MIIHEYETTLIFHPEAPEGEVKRITERLDGVIESFEGAKLFHDVWGVRKLAYPIQKQAHGNYHHLGFIAKAECIAEFERVIRIEAHLIRFLTVRLLENVDVEERKLVASKRAAVISSPDAGEEDEGRPRAHGDAPARPRVSDDAPVRPSVSDDAPAKPSVSDEAPAKPAPPQD